jgi:hypothetical protein
MRQNASRSEIHVGLIYGALASQSTSIPDLKIRIAFAFPFEKFFPSFPLRIVSIPDFEPVELERLLQQILTETDPTRYDDLAAEIWRVLDERERLKRPFQRFRSGLMTGFLDARRQSSAT